ncbi:MAG: hypothetical protein NT141_03135 [candidate division WWE3 bacterium]|nr:hypothetical protein [candidate division WWE3 bacterium]
MTVNSSSSITKKRRKFPKKALIIVGAVLVFLVIFAFFGAVTPATKMLGTAKTLRDEARLLKDAAATQDLDQIKTQLTATNATLSILQSQFKGFGWMQVVPFAAAYYSDATHGLKAAMAGVDAGLKTVDAIYPYAGTIGLKTNKTEAFGSIKEKIAELLVVGPQISQNLGPVRADLDVVSTELNYINQLCRKRDRRSLVSTRLSLTFKRL